MIRPPHFGNVLHDVISGAWNEDRASQLAEFAVALPLLVVFVVGIFDFSGAFTLKQKLTNVAGDAARMAAADPSNDLKSPSAAVPVSVSDAFQMVDSYFLTGNLTDCSPTLNSTTGLTWTYTGTTNCPPGGLTIVINRGYYFPAAGATTTAIDCTSPSLGGQTAVIGTCVSITYAYQWKFGRTASLLGRAISLPTTITASAIAMNEN